MEHLSNISINFPAETASQNLLPPSIVTELDTWLSSDPSEQSPLHLLGVVVHLILVPSPPTPTHSRDWDKGFSVGIFGGNMISERKSEAWENETGKERCVCCLLLCVTDAQTRILSDKPHKCISEMSAWGWKGNNLSLASTPIDLSPRLKIDHISLKYPCILGCAYISANSIEDRTSCMWHWAQGKAL